VRLRRGRPSGDTGWRVTPLGWIVLIGVLACFVLGAITSGVIFFVAACFLLALAAGGYFTSRPNPWRSGGDDDYYGPTGRRVRRPDDDSS
jgi:hypothetical protein